MLEKQIEKKVCDHAREKGILQFKFSSPSQRGVPDRMFITCDGEVHFVEFKTADGALTALQKLTFTQLQVRGLNVTIIRSVLQGKTFVDTLAQRERLYRAKHS